MEEYVTQTQFWEGMRELAADLRVPTNVAVTVSVPDWFWWVVAGSVVIGVFTFVAVAAYVVRSLDA